jgi:predicted dehydrogenase
MKVVVVGCGSIGVRHVRNLRTLGVASVLAVDPAPERRAAAEEAGAVIVPDLETALATRPDAAVICTPPHAHVAPAEAAVRAGLDVFVEKPLAATLAGVDGLLRAAAERGRVICVG